MEYYTYILQSKLSGTFYIGQTQNIDKRIKTHNEGKNRSTKAKRPWELFAVFKTNTRAEAIALETKLKKMKKRQAIINYALKNSFKPQEENHFHPN